MMRKVRRFEEHAKGVRPWSSVPWNAAARNKPRSSGSGAAAAAAAAAAALRQFGATRTEKKLTRAPERLIETLDI